MFKGMKKTKVIVALLLSVLIALEPVSNVMAVEESAENISADDEQELAEETLEEEIDAETEEVIDDSEDAESETDEADSIEETEPLEESEAEEIEELLALDGDELLENTGIKELPDSYVLSQDRIQEKAAMSSMIGDFEKAVEGADYVNEQVFCFADSFDEAEMIAEAYNGELVSFCDGVAVIDLSETEVGVKEVFAAAVDMSLNLPAAYPNYYRYATDDVVTVTSETPEETVVVEAKDSETDGEEVVLLKNSDVTVTEEVNETPDLGEAGPGSRPEAIYDDPMLDPNADLYQWHHAVIGSEYAWNANIRGKDIKVMVIDTGVIASHEDFPDITPLYYEAGFASGVDDHHHGTFVCGEIAAIANNGKGGVGVAPDVTLYSYKAGDEKGSFTDAAINAGINKATELGVDVVNMSLGGYWYDSAYEQSIGEAYDKGVILFASAGNENTTSLSYPASYPHVISVGATDAGNVRASFSNYGSTVDVTGPGAEIKSAQLKDASYGESSGTSMSCPIVAGETALLLQAAKKGMVKSVSPAVAEIRNGKRVDAIEKALKASCKKSSAGMGSGIPYLPTALGITTAIQKPAVPNITVSVSEDKQSVDVTFLNATGMTIYYTTDGSKPTYPATGTTASTKDASKTVNVSGMQTVNAQAIAVNSAGEMSAIKKVSVKLTPIVSTVSITGPTKVAKGKKSTLTASVAPDYATNKKLEWRFVSAAGAPISENITADVRKKGVTVSNGNVSATRTATAGTYYVRAIAVDKNNVAATFAIDVVENGTVSKMSFSGRSLTVNRGGSSPTVDLMNTSSQVYLNALDLSSARIGDGSKFVWSSTNPAVATVDANGVVTFVGGGKSTINVVSNDGNVIKASLTVTVNQLPTSIDITTPVKDGRKYLAIGKSLQLQSAVLPATATNKKVTWEPFVEGKTAAEAKKIFADKGITVSAAGKISATAKATAGDYKVVCRSVADSRIVSSPYTVTVTSGAISSVQVDNKTLNIFRVPGNFSAKTSGTIKFTLSGTGSYDKDSYKVTSSNPNLVSVSDVREGDVITVTAKSTGAAIGKSTVTLESTDGSNKKVSCTVNVINPASELLLGAEGDTGYMVAPGKSIQIKSALGSDFGKLSNNKINWSVDAPSTVATVSSTGVVSIKRTVPSGGSLTVYAEAADGSGAKSQIDVYVNINPVTVEDLGGISNKKLLVCDTEEDGWDYNIPIGFYGTWNSFQITSSNPKIAAAYLDFYEKDGKSYPTVHLCCFKKGRVTVTVKPIDGYGKATKFNFSIE